MYNTEDLEKKAIEAIEKNKLMFIEECVAFLPCAKSTFYEHFPAESDGYKRIFEEIEKVRVLTKATLRGKWYQSKNATTQLALYKLIATKEEQRALSMNVHDIEGKIDGQLVITRRVIKGDSEN